MRLTPRTTNRVRAMAADAIQHDHSCSDASCDIATANDNDLVGWAWHMFHGATDAHDRCDLLTAWWPRLFATVLGDNPYDDGARPNPDWTAWKAHHDRYGRYCDACGSYTYADGQWEPEQCGNCLAVLPVPTEVTD